MKKIRSSRKNCSMVKSSITYVRLGVTSVLCAPALWSDCEEAGDLPCTGCLLETPMVSRSNVMTKAISPGDSCFVNLIAVQVIYERACDSICSSGYAVIVLK